MKVTVVYNEPEFSRYTIANEQEAVIGVLNEVSAVENALTFAGHAVELLGLSLSHQPNKKIRNIKTDLVFNLFEGFSGLPDTEAEIPELLQRQGIPFTGCPASALRLALNKHAFKQILRDGGINTPDSQLLARDSTDSFTLNLPCIVKPGREDASHGLSMNSVVYDENSLNKQVKEYFTKYEDTEVMIEEYIDGREFNATVMGNTDIFLTAISEINFTLPESMPKIITYAGKWDEDSIDYRGTTAICPAELSDNERAAVTDAAKTAYLLAGCRGYARTDFRMDAKGTVYVLEVNPNPDISPGSGAALQAKTAGMDYTAFICKIVDLALERCA